MIEKDLKLVHLELGARVIEDADNRNLDGCSKLVGIYLADEETAKKAKHNFEILTPLISQAESMSNLEAAEIIAFFMKAYTAFTQRLNPVMFLQMAENLEKELKKVTKKG